MKETRLEWAVYIGTDWSPAEKVRKNTKNNAKKTEGQLSRIGRRTTSEVGIGIQ